MATPALPHIPELPDALVAAVAEDAARDADRVGLFLQARGLAGSPQRPARLPAAFLLELAAALRLLAWEQAGLRAHLDAAGLPPAAQALRDLFLAATGRLPGPPASPAGTLAYRVTALFAERFAWDARGELGAEVALGEADEDALLEALADFLWQHRPGRGGREE
jgi:hypothetical protein